VASVDRLLRLLASDRGATVVEYGVMIAIVAVAVAVLVSVFSGNA
jgi:Flp pilus assembly pilin Flp